MRDIPVNVTIIVEVLQTLQGFTKDGGDDVLSTTVPSVSKQESMTRDKFCKGR